MTKKYLNVGYKDRDLVKRLGGRWDPSVKQWYCPEGSTLELIFRWRKPAARVVAKAPCPKNAHSVSKRTGQGTTQRTFQGQSHTRSKSYSVQPYQAQPFKNEPVQLQLAC